MRPVQDRAGFAPDVALWGALPVTGARRDLAGNSLRFDDKLADQLASVFALPPDEEGFTYLRFEPVPAPIIVIRNEAAVTAPGSAVDRLVIRTFNDDISKDETAADISDADRHIIPPRAAIEMGERLGCSMMPAER